MSTDGTSNVTIFYNPLRVAAKLDILLLINLSDCNMILHDVLLQLHSIFNSTKITHGQFLGFVKIVYM